MAQYARLPLEAALFSKLSTASSLTSLLQAGTAGIHPYQAPEGAGLPLVTYSKQSNVPMRVGGGAVAWEDALYLVKGIVGSSSPALAGSIADQIDSALDNKSLSITGYNAMLCRRESDVDYPETLSGGSVLFHRGGLYRIQAQGTA